MPATSDLIKFSDPCQKDRARHCSMRFYLDLDGLRIFFKDEDGDLVDLVDYAGRHPAEDADDLIGFLQDVKRHGIGQTAADDMIGRLFQEFKA